MDSELASVYRSIPGGTELLTWFGDVPSFHDAEIVSILLDRGNASRLHIRAWKGDYHKPDNHAIVSFSIGKIVDVELNGFSGQNVIDGLVLRRALDRPERDQIQPLLTDYEIELEPCYGLFGMIRGRDIRIDLTLTEPKQTMKMASD